MATQINSNKRAEEIMVFKELYKTRLITLVTRNFIDIALKSYINVINTLLTLSYIIKFYLKMVQNK